MFVVHRHVAVPAAIRGYRSAFYDEGFYTPGGRAIQGLLFICGMTAPSGRPADHAESGVFSCLSGALIWPILV